MAATTKRCVVVSTPRAAATGTLRTAQPRIALSAASTLRGSNASRMGPAAMPPMITGAVWIAASQPTSAGVPPRSSISSQSSATKTAHAVAERGDRGPAPQQGEVALAEQAEVVLASAPSRCRYGTRASGFALVGDARGLDMQGFTIGTWLLNPCRPAPIRRRSQPSSERPWPETDVVDAARRGGHLARCREALAELRHDRHDRRTSTSARHQNCSRHGVIRLNIGVGRADVRATGGHGEVPTTRPSIECSPTPCTPSSSGISILNPSDATFRDVVRPLLTEARDQLAAAPSPARRWLNARLGSETREGLRARAARRRMLVEQLEL